LRKLHDITFWIERRSTMIKRAAFEGYGMRVVALWTVIIAGLLASGCSSLLVDVKYHKNPALEQKFSARPAPATVTRDDAKTLEKIVFKYIQDSSDNSFVNYGTA
jgi:hypothetical protein